GTIYISAQPCSWTDDDPSVTFVSNVGSGPSVAIDSTTPNASVKTGFIRTIGPNCVGDAVRIIATGNRQTAGALTATVSVELSAKDGTSFLPNRLTSCVIWLHANDYNPATGFWPDRSGVENDGSQPDQTAYPTLETNFNGFKD